jgi:excinuclease ABC subunit A
MLGAPGANRYNDRMQVPERRRTPHGSEPVIGIFGAREHNLKNLSVAIPRERFVVVTGVSGSGKSTLAFDLLFAEGQRRFLDAMNAYARQFVAQMPRPDVDLITGIPPTVSIEQRTTRGGGKSTVATVTEIHHFLRLLFARLGTLYCPDCRQPVEAQTRDQLAAQLRQQMRQRGDLLLLAPVVRHRKGFHSGVAAWAAKHGYAELRADGKIHRTDQPFRLDRFREHDVEVVIGVLDREVRRRASTAPPAQVLVDAALEVGQGTLLALDNAGVITPHSTARACGRCSRSFEALDPKNFSYNSARGWCPRCRGFGELFYLPDVDRGAMADAIEESWFRWQEGERELCPECGGARLNPMARAVRLDAACFHDRSRVLDPRPHRNETAPTIDTFAAAPVGRCAEYFSGLGLRGRAAMVGRDILPEIQERLRFLVDVGLGYLNLGRSVTTLSGGEAQRIRLAAQLGSNLSGVLYVLDEPTIGLHARDNAQLLEALARLRARGNSLLVVEHDEDTMRHADHIIDLGPGAGVQGGRVVASGTLAELMRHPESLTGQWLCRKRHFPTRGLRRPVSGMSVARAGAAGEQNPAQPPGWLVLREAAANNLRRLTVAFPLQRLVLITGVSGSGKSTLVRECLLPALSAALDRKRPAASPILSGHESLHAVYAVDQSPIGRTPRSIPATYVGFFDDIRALFAQLPEARMRGYTASRFSFNSAQGRCPTCQGAGLIKLEMNFLPPAFARCDACEGTRFNRETLDVELNGKHIAAVLELSVAEALDFFAAFPRIRRPLEALRDTGLDYVKLGQTSPTLSGGEAQRLKLVTHLLTGMQRPTGLRDSGNRHKLFILEEPTIGLHMSDVGRLVEVLQRLVDTGHTVIVIEHNLDLIAEADWVIDLGPEGGEGGGRIVVAGTPEHLARCSRSYTGGFLKRLL